MAAAAAALKASFVAEHARLGQQFLPFLECTLLDGLSPCFKQFDPSVSCFWLCALVALYCLVGSVVTGNCSKVDQLWSITPVVYAWLVYLWPSSHHAGHHTRLLVVTLLITVWGVRLTYNFSRRGGYSPSLWNHEEDYRWPVLRRVINNPVLFFVFNVTFIASYQNLLLLLIAAPVFEVARGPTAMNTHDWLATVAMLLLIAGETLADQQQWEFHLRKLAVPVAKRATHPDPDVRDGFFQSGLFKYSRHPNYFCEQSIWVVVYAFSVTHATSVAELWNVWVAGPVLLILLFQGSAAFSESITASKYPGYKDYQRRTSQFFPWIPAERQGVVGMKKKAP
jgi:steroid 5-alpha reductase family enzyme